MWVGCSKLDVVTSNSVYICENLELQEDIILSSCVINFEIRKCTVSIVNYLQQTVEIDEPFIELESIELNKTNGKKVINFVGNVDCDHSSLRLNRIVDSLRLDHLNVEEKDSLVELISEYSYIFHLEGEKLTTTNAIIHKIELKRDSVPVNVRQYRLPFSQQEEIQNQINVMLKIIL